MYCALWLNRKKIFSAAEISENLDIAALRGYFLAGSLVRWLNEHGGENYARRLSKLSPSDPGLNEKIAEIFGSAKLPGVNGGADVVNKRFGSGDALSTAAADMPSSYLPSSFPLSSHLPSSYILSSYLPTSYLHSLLAGSGGSFAFSSGISSLMAYPGGGLGNFEYNFGSFGYLYGSFNYYFGSFGYFFGSFENYSGYFGSGRGQFGSYGSFWLWEWLWKNFYLFGSFGGSFGGGFGGGFGGSFALGSYGFGSFWEWFRLFGNLGSFNWGNLSSFAGYGSFPGDLEKLPLDEYDLIMLKTLVNCPLDRFGYGIHNI